MDNTIKVIMLTFHEDRNIYLKLLIGANSYVLKDAE